MNLSDMVVVEAQAVVCEPPIRQFSAVSEPVDSYRES